jgi:hypothetical protein
MIIPGVSDGPAPLMAAEAGIALTGSRLPATARPRLRAAAPRWVRGSADPQPPDADAGRQYRRDN